MFGQLMSLALQKISYLPGIKAFTLLSLLWKTRRAVGACWTCIARNRPARFDEFPIALMRVVARPMRANCAQVFHTAIEAYTSHQLRSQSP